MNTKEPVSGVEENRAEALSGMRAEPGDEKRGDFFGRSKRQSSLWRHQQRPAPELDGRRDAAGLGCAHARQARKTVQAHFCEAMDPAKVSQKRRRDLERTLTCGAMSKNQRQEFGVTKCSDARSRKLFARPVVTFR